MGLLLILFWRAAVVGRRESPNILPDNSRFGAFISRFGRLNSWFEPLWEFSCKGLVYLTILTQKQQLSGENRQNSRFNREKPGI
jgi:hypothetical protein